MLCNKSACNSTITLPLVCTSIPRTTAGASEAHLQLSVGYRDLKTHQCRAEAS